MTVILAAVDSDGKVKIAGDSQASTGYDYSYKLDRPKVKRIGDYLVGGAGCAATLRRFQYGIKYPKPPKKSVENFMLNKFRESVVKQLKGVSIGSDTSLMFVVQDRVYGVYVTKGEKGALDITVYPGQLPMAVGCGFLSAIGAYKALEGSKDRIKKAMEIAVEVSPGCGGEVTVIGMED